MELFSTNIKVFTFPEMKPCTSQPKPPKNPKNSLHFRKWKILALILKKFLYSLKRKLFLYFLKIKLFLYFRKWNPAHFSPSSKNKKIYQEEISYSSGNESPPQKNF